MKEILEFNQKSKRIEKLIFIATFFKSKKLILKILEEQYLASKNLAISILKFSHIKGEIKLQNNPDENLKILKETIANNWEIKKEVDDIISLFNIHKKHKESPIEFMKKGIVIILDEEQNIEKITINKLKKISKSTQKIRNIFEGRI